MTIETTTPPFPSLEDWQHWTWVMGRAQQMLMEAWADSLKKDEPIPGFVPANATDPMAWMTAGFWPCLRAARSSLSKWRPLGWALSTPLAKVRISGVER